MRRTTVFKPLAFALAFGLSWVSLAAIAGEADVIDVQVRGSRDQGYRIDVTVRHADEGWEHYADRWEVLTPGGEVLATRVLHHPHVEEQPFTRSLSGVRVPEGIEEIVIRARDSQHGFGGRTWQVKLP